MIENVIDSAREKVKSHFVNGELHAEVFSEIGKGSPFSLAEKQILAIATDEKGISAINDVIDSKGADAAASMLASNWKLLILERLQHYYGK